MSQPSTSWGSEDVAEWLVGLGPGFFAATEKVLQNDVSGADLVLLEDADLLDLGIESADDRAVVLSAIANMFASEGAPIKPGTLVVEMDLPAVQSDPQGGGGEPGQDAVPSDRYSSAAQGSLASPNPTSPISPTSSATKSPRRVSIAGGDGSARMSSSDTQPSAAPNAVPTRSTPPPPPAQDARNTDEQDALVSPHQDESQQRGMSGDDGDTDDCAEEDEEPPTDTATSPTVSDPTPSPPPPQAAPPSREEILSRAFAALLGSAPPSEPVVPSDGGDDEREHGHDSRDAGPVYVALEPKGKGKYDARFAGSAARVKDYLMQAPKAPARDEDNEDDDDDDDEWEWIEDKPDFLLMEATSLYQFRTLAKLPPNEDFKRFGAPPRMAPVYLDDPTELARAVANYQFRSPIDIDNMDDWKPAGRAMAARRNDTKDVTNALEPNVVHPSQLPPRHFNRVAPDLEWRVVGRPKITGHLIDTCVTESNRAPFRDLAPLPRDLEWHRSAASDEPLPPLPPDVEPSVPEASIHRDMNPDLEWHASTRAGALQTKGVDNDPLSPDTTHPSLYAFRDHTAMGHDVDWSNKQRRDGDDALPPLPPDTDVVTPLPHTSLYRDTSTTSGPGGWNASNRLDPKLSKGGQRTPVEPGMGVSDPNFRDLAPLDASVEWKRAGAKTHRRTSFPIEDGDVYTEHAYNFRGSADTAADDGSGSSWRPARRVSNSAWDKGLIDTTPSQGMPRDLRDVDKSDPHRRVERDDKGRIKASTSSHSQRSNNGTNAITSISSSSRDHAGSDWKRVGVRTMAQEQAKQGKGIIDTTPSTGVPNDMDDVLGMRGATPDGQSGWKTAGSASHRKLSAIDTTPSIGILDDFRGAPELSRNVDFQRPNKTETGIEPMKPGVERNLIHPSQVSVRDTGAGDMFRMGRGKDGLMSDKLLYDTTPSIGLLVDFRGAPDIAPADDFHNVAKSDRATVALPSGVEANAMHPSQVATRDTTTLSGGGGESWRHAGSRRPHDDKHLIDTTPSIGLMHDLRGAPDLHRNEDFQAPGKGDSAIEPLRSGVEVNQVHPSNLPMRGHDDIDEAFRFGIGKGVTAPLGFDTTPSIGILDNFRGAPDLDREDDFHFPKASDKGPQALPFGIEGNAAHPAHASWRDLEGPAGEERWRTGRPKDTSSRDIYLAGPSIGMVDAFRGDPDISHADNFHRLAKTDSAIEPMRPGVEANVVHPSQLSSRDTGNAVGPEDYFRVGKAAPTYKIPLDTTPSVGILDNFRGAPDIPHADDFQFAGKSESAIEFLRPGVEPDAMHPTHRTLRDPSPEQHDWRPTGKVPDKTMRSVVDPAPSISPEHHFRDTAHFDHDIDFLAPSKTDSAIEPMRAGIEPNAVHPSQLPTRGSGRGEDDWKRGTHVKGDSTKGLYALGPSVGGAGAHDFRNDQGPAEVWRPAGSSDPTARKPMEKTPSVGLLVEFRGEPHLPRDQDFQRPSQSETAIEQARPWIDTSGQHPGDHTGHRDFDRLASHVDFIAGGKIKDPRPPTSGLEANTVHTSNLALRDMSKFDRDHDFHRTAAGESAIEPQSSGVESHGDNHPSQMAFRTTAPLSPESDFHRVGPHTTTTVPLRAGGLEPNTTHPLNMQYRDLDRMHPDHAFQGVGRGETALEPLPGGVERSRTHPEHHVTRNVDVLDASIDFQRVGASDSAIEPLPRGVEGNASHPHNRHFRDMQHYDPDVDFHRHVGRSETAIEPQHYGLPGNDVHPSQVAMRDLTRYDVDHDFQYVGASDTALEPLSRGVEANQRNPDAHTFRDLSHIEAEHDWRRAGNAHGVTKPLPIDTQPSQEHAFRFRDNEWKGPADADFQIPTAGESAIEPLPRGVEGNGVNPDDLVVRQFEHMSPEHDWHVGIKPTPSVENARHWPGSNDVVTESKPKDELKEVERGWSVSTKVPQPRVRRVPANPRPAKTNKKKKAEPWCMAMLDAQRGKTKKRTKAPRS
eukprot:m.8675 g.8675  ORF g.8675 m.8675 type:complete len:1966 (+) comp2557_c0_seq1:95-5992(+)